MKGWTPELDALARRLRAEGLDNGAIGRRIGKTTAAVFGRLRRPAHSPIRANGESNLEQRQLAEIMRLAGEGQTDREIGLALNLSKTSVRNRRRAAGTVRPLSGRAWPPERDARLRELHSAGKSMGEIAAVLGCTRSAIAGRARRLKLRSSPEITATTRRLASVRGGMVTAQRMREGRIEKPAHKQRPPKAAKPKLAVPPPQPPKPVQPAPEGGLTMLQLGTCQCRWPIHGDGADTLFCGASTNRTMWCEAHNAIGWTPRPEGRKRADVRSAMYHAKRAA